jgi:hypothetical protein
VVAAHDGVAVLLEDLVEVDVGLAGPVVGFLFAVPALAIAVLYSRVVPFSDAHASVVFGQPLVMRFLVAAIRPGVAPGDLLLHPVGRAAWVGFFATALNLLPGGQLDGGHILYSVASKYHRKITLIVALLLIPLGLIFWKGWIMWSVLLLAMLNPVQTAEEVASLDIMSEGRVVFGVGIGYRDVEFKAFGVPRAGLGLRRAGGVLVVRALVAAADDRLGHFSEGHHRVCFLLRIDVGNRLFVQIDDAGNVLAIHPGANRREKGPYIALSAHIDTVFPPESPLEIRQESTKLLGPGVSDNGAGVTAKMTYYETRTGAKVFAAGAVTNRAVAA